MKAGQSFRTYLPNSLSLPTILFLPVWSPWGTDWLRQVLQVGIVWRDGVGWGVPRHGNLYYCPFGSIMGEGAEVGIVPRFSQELFDRVEGSVHQQVRRHACYSKV